MADLQLQVMQADIQREESLAEKSELDRKVADLQLQLMQKQSNWNASKLMKIVLAQADERRAGATATGGLGRSTGEESGAAQQREVAVRMNENLVDLRVVADNALDEAARLQTELMELQHTSDAVEEELFVLHEQASAAATRYEDGARMLRQRTVGVVLIVQRVLQTHAGVQRGDEGRAGMNASLKDPFAAQTFSHIAAEGQLEELDATLQMFKNHKLTTELETLKAERDKLNAHIFALSKTTEDKTIVEIEMKAQMEQLEAQLELAWNGMAKVIEERDELRTQVNVTKSEGAGEVLGFSPEPWRP